MKNVAKRKNQNSERTDIDMGSTSGVPNPVATNEEQPPNDSGAVGPTVSSQKADNLPDNFLLAMQLLESAPRCDAGIDQGTSLLIDDTFALFRSLASRNPLESLLLRQLVAISNASMDCYAKAGKANDLATRDLNLKYGMKGTMTVAALLESLAKLRGQVGQNVSVNNVNVEAGGQAIVDLKVGDRRPIEGDGAMPSIDPKNDR